MRRDNRRLVLVVGALGVLGAIGCVIGGFIDSAAFFRAWLCSYLFWLGVPLAGVTLVFVHDLSGGAWMATARPALNAAIVTMPLASLAGIPAFIGLDALYVWTHPATHLANVFYLNPTAFFIRYGVYVILWNLLAAYALLGPRRGGFPIAPGLSWISGLGLVALAFSASFAAIDWILSLEPTFWSSAFLYAQAASWFNTGMSFVLLIVAVTSWDVPERRAHMADLARILLATTIFWAYIEFIQYLIVWEENLKSEIPWYLKRLDPAWIPATYVAVGLGFVVPFLVLLWAPPKRNRAVVATVCVSILISRIANTWLLVMPEFSAPTPLWLDIAVWLALGGAMTLLFGWGRRYPAGLARANGPILATDHG
jgi:hypothetical protein